jgi:hypothetical protein
MALYKGKTDASTGLTKVLYDAMDAELRPPLEQTLRDAKVPEAEIAKAVEQARVNWKQLSHTLAAGLVPALRGDAGVEPSPSGPPAVAETFSSNIEDPAFWNWFGSFLANMRTWAQTAGAPIAVRDFLNDTASYPHALKGAIR